MTLSFISIVLFYSSPLILAALGGVISERSGIVNIGLEGIMTIGAFFAALVGYYTNSWIGLLFAGLAGGLLALLHALASITFKADQVISGISINFLGVGFATFLSKKFFSGATVTPPVTKTLPSFLGQNIVIYLTFLLVFIVWFVLYKTKIGLRIRAIGEKPQAADTLGVNVSLVRYCCVMTSGIFAGLGGAVMSLVVVSQFTNTLISGHGFIALAAVIFGKWTPQGAMLSCLLFGFSQALTVVFGGLKIPIPIPIIEMLPYVLTLIILVIFVGKSTAPKALGNPYEKGKR